MKPTGRPKSPCPSKEKAFVTTRWTRVLAACGKSPEAEAALGELCEAYYQPVFAYIRRAAPDEQDARDLTHEFFLRLLARHGVDTADPARGRFRSFLLGAVKHFLSDMRDRNQAAKRGGGHQHDPLLPPTDTSPGMDPPDPRTLSPEREFDRQWALTTLSRALDRLAADHAAEGRSLWFETLKPWLTGDSGSPSQADAGARLGLSQGAVKVAVHRLKRRFRRVLQDEIAATLNDPRLIQEEFDNLLDALSSR